MRLVVVLGGEVDLPHALLEQVDEEQVEAGHHAHHKEEEEERGGRQLEHLVVQTLAEEVGEGDLHLASNRTNLAGNFKIWRETLKFWREIKKISGGKFEDSRWEKNVIKCRPFCLTLLIRSMRSSCVSALVSPFLASAVSLGMSRCFSSPLLFSVTPIYGRWSLNPILYRFRLFRSEEGCMYHRQRWASTLANRSNARHRSNIRRSHFAHL